MQNKRMSLTLSNKCPLRQQMDQILQADYKLLNQHPNQANTVLQCHLARDNHIIQRYIQVVEEDYNVPSPLKNRPSKVSSTKKLELSILSASKEHFDARAQDKNKKKLTITAKKQSNQSIQVHSNQNGRESEAIMTPKFFHWEQQSDKAKSNELLQYSSRSKLSKDASNSLNRILSKQKPISSTGHHEHSTAKKTVNVDESQLSHHNFESRVTIKRLESPSPKHQKIVQQNDFIHKNPIINKMQKKNLEQYCRPGRITSSIIQQPKKLKIKQSYRYCIGCEAPILESNIRTHQKQCAPFQQISSLPSNLEVLRIVQGKITAIQSRIPSKNLQIQPQHAQQVRNKSANLVRQSRRREECSPQSTNFRRDYDSIMQIGKKWCSSIEEVNKLRWFTRIAQKLESMLSKEQ